MNYLARLMAITHTTVTAVVSTPARRKPVGGPWLLLAACLWLGSGQSIAASGSTTLSGFVRPDANLADYRRHVVLLLLWASWCAPCLREIPALDAFYDGPVRTLSDRGLVGVAVRTHFTLPAMRDSK